MSPRIPTKALLLFSSLCVAVSAAAAQRSPPPVTISGTELHSLPSKIVDDEFTVQVALPSSYGSGEKSYPVVYALDADLSFASLAGSVRMAAFAQEMPEVILVSQGYANPAVQRVMTSRSRDYTPIESAPPAAAGVSEESPPPTGGAPAFLRVLREEVIPFVEKTYRTTEQRVFAGHSYGGLFGLYALFHAPQTFDAYLLGSPSIWFGDEVSFDYEATYAEDKDDLAARVFFGVGFLEEVPGLPPSDRFLMVTNTRKMYQRLKQRNYPSLELELVLFDEETHMSVVPPLMGRGLRWLLRSEQTAAPTESGDD
ncbi:MAG: alpha/beta hydrolase-fold protein [Acidobacteriota bacterium]